MRGMKTSGVGASEKETALSRRAFAQGASLAGVAAGSLGVAAALRGLGVARASEGGDAQAEEIAAGEIGIEASDAAVLPPASPDPDDQFGVDLNVNMDTIDNFLGLRGVAYRDMRMLRDPADYASIGGDSVLSIAIEGFRVVPFPYVGTLQELPVSGAYAGDRLFDITWADDGSVASAMPRYEESEQIIEDLFPRTEPIILCCGGGGYAGMMRRLLVYLGYDESRLYNAGGVWDYVGYYPIELAKYDDETGDTTYFMWRADVADIDFSELSPKD
jgi:hypothetical protein